jgi:hypothetical protein
MAKGQKRSSRETKKPKQQKSERSGAIALAPASVAAARDRVSSGGRDQPGGRKGRR